MKEFTNTIGQIAYKTRRDTEGPLEVNVYQFSTAAALLTFGAPFIAVKNDNDGKYYYAFKYSDNTYNSLVLYERQALYLLTAGEKAKYTNGKKIMESKAKFGGTKSLFKETTKKIKGAPRKSNGVWKA